MLDNDGTLTAWEFHNYNSGHSAIEGRYEIPNQPHRVSSRALASSAGLVSRPSPRRRITSHASPT